MILMFKIKTGYQPHFAQFILVVYFKFWKKAIFLSMDKTISDFDSFQASHPYQFSANIIP